MSHRVFHVYAVLTLVSAACAGTLDEDAFRAQGASDGPPVGAQDAGTTIPESDAAIVVDAGAWDDAGAEPASDASTAPAKDAGGASDAGSADAGTAIACDFKALMQQKCGGSACHGGPSSSTGLDLTSENLAMRVRGKKGSGGCTSSLIIDPDNPAESVLYTSVTDDTCTTRMPIGQKLPDSEQQCILQWIEAL